MIAQSPLLWTFLLALENWCVCDEFPHTQDDPWTARDRCYSEFFPYPQCQCNESRVSCVNAQMTDADVFMHMDKYPNVVSATFRGNNFGELPANVFGHTEYNNLLYLNLSANYFVKIDAAAFNHMPNVISLDLSYNELQFDDSDVALLATLPQLEELRLRKAFPHSMNNATRQIGILHRMLMRAKLNRLRLLDMGYNELDSIPERFGCAMPNLEQLLLAGNSFRVFHVDYHCFKRLRRLDLSDNGFARLDQQLIRFFDYTPSILEINLQRNPFVCDNSSRDFIQWIRSTPSIVDKPLITCQPIPDDWCLVSVMNSALDPKLFNAQTLCNAAQISLSAVLQIYVVLLFIIVIR